MIWNEPRTSVVALKGLAWAYSQMTLKEQKLLPLLQVRETGSDYEYKRPCVRIEILVKLRLLIRVVRGPAEERSHVCLNKDRFFATSLASLLQINQRNGVRAKASS